MVSVQFCFLVGCFCWIFDLFCAIEGIASVGCGYAHFFIVIVECEISGGVVFGVVVYAAQFYGAGFVAVVGVGLDLVFPFVAPCGLR